MQESSGVAASAGLMPMRRSTSGEPSPHAPKTRPRTGSYVRSLFSTGPVDPAGVLQYFRSRVRALSAYSLGRVRARRATASHLSREAGYVVDP